MALRYRVGFKRMGTSTVCGLTVTVRVLSVVVSTQRGPDAALRLRSVEGGSLMSLYYNQCAVCGVSAGAALGLRNLR